MEQGSRIKTKPERPYTGDTPVAAGNNGSSQGDADFRAGAVSPEQESANAAFFAAGGVDARLAEILADIDKLLRDYIVFPNNAAAVAATLWVPHTWALDAFDFTPYLHLHSPVKECGKTRVFECLVKLCKNGWHTFGPTEAVLFRKINAHEPTLLLDEVDTVFKDKVDPKMEGIRAVLNAGYERGVVVPRCDGANHELKEFRVFGPKAFAGIGNIPDTIASRSIKIPITRRRRDQKIKRLRKRELAAAAAPIVQALEEWSSDLNVITRLRAARPEMPTELGDRSEDICEPLVAIADMAGGEWPENARAALVRLRTPGDTDTEETKIQLLACIREIFKQQPGARHISSQALIEALVKQDGEPWAAWWGGDVATGNIKGPGGKLAKLLKPFGIISRSVKEPDGTTPKGYPLTAFDDAFARYLPPDTPSPAP